MQGVSYRATARDAAQGYGLVGWVRNLPDGDVEAVAQGDAQAVEAFVRWCHTGPGEARVEQVDATEQPLASEPDGFRVVR